MCGEAVDARLPGTSSPHLRKPHQSCLGAGGRVGQKARGKPVSGYALPKELLATFSSSNFSRGRGVLRGLKALAEGSDSF